MCFIKNDRTGRTVKVTRGQMGYEELSNAYASVDPDVLNSHCGVSKAQAEAMKIGSMFGWHVPGADPKVHERYLGR
jgi:hypothetical protein